MKDDFYVYVYLDPRKPGEYVFDYLKFDYEPFYVGKGKGNRFKAHFYECHNFNNYKWNKIQKIKNLKLNPIIVKVFENLTEQDAFLKEIEIISKIRRKILTNMSNGGEGQSGYKHKPETKIKISEGVKNSEKYQKSIRNDEYLKKLSLSLIGHKGWNKGGVRSEFDREKIKNGLKKSTKKGFVQHSKESKIKMSEKAKGINNNNSTIYEIMIPNGDIVRIKGRENVRKYLMDTTVKLSMLFKYNYSDNYTIISKVKQNN